MKTHSRKINTSTIKLLLARSGNQCAFPDCVHPLFSDESDKFIAQLCHIEAVSPNGQRYNPNKTSEETNSYENLLFLCYRHHKETDDTILFPVEKLQSIKAEHEANFKENTYNYSDKNLAELFKDINTYWTDIERLNTIDHVVPDLAIHIDIQSDIPSLLSDIGSHLRAIENINSMLMQDHKKEQFELVCLALPNLLAQVSVAIQQIQIKYYEELLLINPNSEEYKTTLEYLRQDFAKTAQSIGYSD